MSFKIVDINEQVDTLIRNGSLPSDYKSTSAYKRIFTKAAIIDNLMTPEEAMSNGHITELEAVRDGYIKPSENGGDFGIRASSSFADTQDGKINYLKQHYGKDNVSTLNGDIIYKDDKGWNTFDSNSIELADIADLVGDLPELIGATALGTVGAISGAGGASIPAGMAGAAVGGASGRGVKKGIANAIGIEDNQTSLDIAKDIGESALYSGVGEGVGLFAGKGITKLLSPNASKYGAEQIALEKLAKKVGIKLTASDTMGGGLVNVENAMRMGLGGGKIDDIKQSQFTQLRDYLLDGVNKGTNGRNNIEIGESIQKNLSKGINDTKGAFNKQYEDLVRLVDDGTISLDNAQVMAQNLLKESEADVLKPFIDNGTTKQLEAIAGITSNGIVTPKVDYNTFKTLRTNVGDLANSPNIIGNSQNGKFKQVSNALNGDFDRFAKQRGLGGFKSEIDNSYKGFRQDIGRPEIKNIIGTTKKTPIDAERIVDTVVTPKGVARTNRVSQYTENNDDMSGGLLNNYINKSTTIAKDGTEYVSSTKLGSQRKKYSDVEANIMPDRDVQLLDNFEKLGNATRASSPDILNPSGTANSLVNYTDFGFMGLPIAGKKLASTYYTSPTGYKHLTKGLMDTTSKGATVQGLGMFGANIPTLLRQSPKSTNMERKAGQMGVKTAHHFKNEE